MVELEKLKNESINLKAELNTSKQDFIVSCDLLNKISKQENCTKQMLHHANEKGLTLEKKLKNARITYKAKINDERVKQRVKEEAMNEEIKELMLRIEDLQAHTKELEMRLNSRRLILQKSEATLLNKSDNLKRDLERAILGVSLEGNSPLLDKLASKTANPSPTTMNERSRAAYGANQCASEAPFDCISYSHLDLREWAREPSTSRLCQMNSRDRRLNYCESPFSQRDDLKSLVQQGYQKHDFRGKFSGKGEFRGSRGHNYAEESSIRVQYHYKQQAFYQDENNHQSRNLSLQSTQKGIIGLAACESSDELKKLSKNSISINTVLKENHNNNYINGFLDREVTPKYRKRGLKAAANGSISTFLNPKKPPYLQRVNSCRTHQNTFFGIQEEQADGCLGTATKKRGNTKHQSLLIREVDDEERQTFGPRKKTICDNRNSILTTDRTHSENKVKGEKGSLKGNIFWKVTGGLLSCDFGSVCAKRVGSDPNMSFYSPDSDQACQLI